MNSSSGGCRLGALQSPKHPKLQLGGYRYAQYATFKAKLMAAQRTFSDGLGGSRLHLEWEVIAQSSTRNKKAAFVRRA